VVWAHQDDRNYPGHGGHPSDADPLDRVETTCSPTVSPWTMDEKPPMHSK
jgi:hypothetical protein